MPKKPNIVMVSDYELDENGVEVLVYREANYDEYADVRARQAAAANAVPDEHPLIRQVKDMSDEDRATLKELLA